jgi:hypothetical protein
MKFTSIIAFFLSLSLSATAEIVQDLDQTTVYSVEIDASLPTNSDEANCDLAKIVDGCMHDYFGKQGKDPEFVDIIILHPGESYGGVRRLMEEEQHRELGYVCTWWWCSIFICNLCSPNRRLQMGKRVNAVEKLIRDEVKATCDNVQGAGRVRVQLQQ